MTLSQWIMFAFALPSLVWCVAILAVEIRDHFRAETETADVLEYPDLRAVEGGDAA